MSYFISGGN